MKTLCYSVRLESLVSISDKCFLARSFNGSEDLIPKSQVFGQDYSVQKSQAYWISAWILEKKKLQYSSKKEAWFYNDSRKMAPQITITKHVPEKVTKEIIHDASLTR
ncbi:MAG: hypothetical protein A2X13_14810 [Bacteroidetes bacterium GWC2_33_15]|nr:MAG: hypothetical protein A2X10_06875 [Bacteroidetes bacterium GWA2_33_15]OFX50144.1 MAG: hypothetical protein A2X13_14810 [Bacteroidetes bacterium GWC2_33_15]OFX65297.1 MAG: hypothetical protein A2X15_04385 [Bacteroidetes bacterium GWB2_32_14]OFX70523.1 MAG: hypothetical protein A2X14_04440 [Bacteroidetes bacterium GWD2_33_33]HAN19604.1 hypothetical protein [Bacteroidales bacterium]